MRQLTVRLKPGQDLKKEIEALAGRENVRAGVLASAVGALSRVRLRLAGAQAGAEEIAVWDGPHEIVGATGTVSAAGCHVHVAVADRSGQVRGGHLKDGCVVAYTAEIVVLVFDDVTYGREPDASTGYRELVVS